MKTIVALLMMTSMAGAQNIIRDLVGGDDLICWEEPSQPADHPETIVFKITGEHREQWYSCGDPRFAAGRRTFTYANLMRSLAQGSYGAK